MLVLWLATGLLGASQEQPPVEQPEIIGGGGFDYAHARRIRDKRRREEDERRKAELEAALREEAERQAAEALAEFEAAEKQKYLKRLDELLAMQVVRIDVDATNIAKAADSAVQALIAELEVEFDRYIARLEFERDEEDAVIALLLAA